MGHRELFVYITGKGSIEELLEIISKKIKMNGSDDDFDFDEPSITVHCKAKVLKDFTNGIDGLLKGTVGAVISPEEITSNELNDILSDVENIDFAVFDIWGLPEDYEKLFEDSEIKVGNKTYFSQQTN